MRWACVLLAACLFLCPLQAIGETDILRSEVFLVVLLKALNYDRKIDRIAEGKIVIGIIYINGDGQAQSFAQKIKDSYQEIQSTTQIKNLPTDCKILGLDKTIDRKTLEEELKQDHISVVVVANQEADSNKVIFDTTRALSIDSVCYSSQCVKEGGGLGIVPKNNRSQILVNMSAVGQEGSDYTGQFLDLCEAVK